MFKRLILLLPLLILSLSGCSLPAIGTQTPENLSGLTETPFQPQQELTPLPDLSLVDPSAEGFDSSLSLEQLQNAEYTTYGIDSAPQTYRMQEGSYRTGTDTAAIGYLAISLISPQAFGSLNNDEHQDAAVILVENSGGTGQFVNIAAILNRAGEPYHVASFLLGDRVQVNALSIQNQEILADVTVHGPEEPACCPTVPANIHLRLLNDNQLFITRFSTKTPSGQERAINIRAPLSGAEVSGSVTITGDITIAPFENNLIYTVYDSEYREISQSYIMVEAPDMGAPGTFSLTIDLDALGHSGDIYVEIIDISAANGSVLALAQIQLKVR